MADRPLGEFRRLGVFADLNEHELRALADELAERFFAEGSLALRKGTRSTGLFIILEGEVGVVIDDEERATLSTGSFFGEVSVLLGEPTTADIVARTALRCLVIAPERTQEFLLSHPQVMFRMLQTEARRLRTVDPMRNLRR